MGGEPRRVAGGPQRESLACRSNEGDAMAEAFPKVSNTAWRTLRSRVSSAPSTKLTPTGVAAILGLASPVSARSNVVAPLRRLGLIDDDGSLTSLGQKWRVNSTYPQACEEIIKEIYPEELSSLTGEDGKPDLGQVKTWFSHKGFGNSNASQMAGTFVMIAVKDPLEASPGDQQPAQGKKTRVARGSKRNSEKS